MGWVPFAQASGIAPDVTTTCIDTKRLQSNRKSPASVKHTHSDVLTMSCWAMHHLVLLLVMPNVFCMCQPALLASFLASWVKASAVT